MQHVFIHSTRQRSATPRNAFAALALAGGVLLAGCGGADFGNHTIRRITPAGVVSTVLGVAGQQGVQLGTQPRLDSPPALAIAGRTLVITAANAVLTYTLP